MLINVQLQKKRSDIARHSVPLLLRDEMSGVLFVMNAAALP
ncbi:hypothetical protein ACI77J_28860 [Pseudomonas sp. O64]|nr:MULTISPECIES: hypothetical protein [unclassified Pseudomonas]